MPTKVDIANDALLRVGDATISAFEDASDRARLVNQLWDRTADACLRAHPWNFAIRRVVLATAATPGAALTPGATSGTGVTFTITGPFTWATRRDIGRVIIADAGRATITSVTDATRAVATINVAFAATTQVATGSWYLSTLPPAFGFAYAMTLPDGFFADGGLKCLRVLDLYGNPDFKVERQTIITDESTINVRYVGRATDPEEWDALFTETFTAYLSAKMGYAISGAKVLADQQWNLYKAMLAQARGVDGMEGTPESFESNDLTDVRR
jgi:hypothetical protein